MILMPTYADDRLKTAKKLNAIAAAITGAAAGAAAGGAAASS